MRTAVSVGVGTDCIARLNLLKKKLEITKMEIDKIEQGLAKFEEMEKERGVSYREDPRRVALLRTRIQNMATLAGDEGEVKRLEHMISDGANATVCVTRDVFPGVSIAIRDQNFKCKKQCKVRRVLSSERKNLHENSRGLTDSNMQRIRNKKRAGLDISGETGLQP